MKFATLLFALFTFIAGTNLQSCYTTKKSDNPNDFTITIAGKSFEGTNQELQQPPTLRSAKDVQVASEYLLHFATAANIGTKIANDLKDKDKLLPAIWAAIPYLISDLPSLINAGKSLKNFQSFYIAAGGLTANERADVANYFAASLNIPFSEAEAISEATIEAALANMKLVGTVQGVVKEN